MKWFISIIFVILFLCSCAGTRQQGIINVPEQNVSFISPPSNWERLFFTSPSEVRPGETIPVKFFMAAWRNSDLSSIGISGGSISEKRTMESNRASLIYGIKKEVDELRKAGVSATYSISNETSDTLREGIIFTKIEADIRATGDDSDENIEIKTVLYSLESSNYVYFLQFKAMDKYFDKDIIVFEQLLDSISFVGHNSAILKTDKRKSGIEKPNYTILGGPRKGTFTVLAKGISELGRKEKINIRNKSSKGSFENIRRINAHKNDFAIAFASHIFNARNGLLKGDTDKYCNIMVIGYLYGAQAQLVVGKHINIESSEELTTSKVNVGQAGSGSFYNCQIFFKELGIWDKIWRESKSDYDAAKHLIKNEIDAFWSFSGYPNKAVTMAARESDINLIDIYHDALSTGFFDKYPYFSKAVIPAYTYHGIEKDTPTFQDSALLIAHKDVPDNVVKELLQIIYSEQGIKTLEKKKAAAKFMKDNNGVYGISTPLHPGASQYYDDLILK